MKTIIYYFTGTGNSLAAAKKICGGLGDCELVPVASMAGTQGEVVPPAGRGEAPGPFGKVVDLK